MNTLQLFTSGIAFGLVALTASSALAEPVLRTNVAVSSAIVTAGDIFSGAGTKAERGMFRAPAPGTTGRLSLQEIRVAAARVGINDFHHETPTRISVARRGIMIDDPMLSTLVTNELKKRGIITDQITADIQFSTRMSIRYAADAAEPVRLNDLRYINSSNEFSARLSIAGYDTPAELRGRITLMVDVPHLTKSLPLGAIVNPSDIEMRPIQLAFAQNGGLAMPEDLIGKQLRRPARQGMMLRPSDVAAPQVISRSELVTIFYQQGPMRLTIKGQALNDAALGEAVTVLNPMSKKTIQGIASDYGTVEMFSASGTGSAS